MSITDPAGASVIGANGMTALQSYNGGFNPNNPNARPGTLPKLDFRIVRGPANHLYLKVDSILPNVVKYQLYFVVTYSTATNLPSSVLNYQINMVEFTPSSGNPENVYPFPPSLTFDDSHYSFYLKAIDQNGRATEVNFEALFPNESVQYFHSCDDEQVAAYAPLNEEKLKWHMRFRMSTPFEYELPIHNDFEDFGFSYVYIPNEIDLYFQDRFDDPCFLYPMNPTWLYIGDFDQSFAGIGEYYDDVENRDLEMHSFDLTLYPPDINSQTFIRMTNEFTNYYGLKLLGYTVESTVDSAQVTLAPFGEANITSLQPNYRIYSNVEQPELQVIEYYFGNFFTSGRPPSPELSPEYTLGKTNPLLIASVRSTYEIEAWAKLKIYRPGSQTPVPDRYGYLQQYWDKAYLCGANGDVPRTGEDNLGGRKKIDTNAAVQTGLLSPLGVFTPTQPGKVILTTRPDTNGFYGECVVYVLDIQLDSNHDGVMDNLDFTSENRPFVFWVNNDVDRDEDEETGTLDFQFRDTQWRPVIPGIRDLEDYARLWLPGVSNLVSSLPSGYTVELNWKNQDAPGINIFKAMDSIGGPGYLTNANISASQLTNYVGSVSSFQKAILTQNNDFYMFCGSARGEGELLLQVKDPSGVVIAETSAFIHLKDIKEMYERWSVGDDGDVEPLANAYIARDFLPRGVSPYRYNFDQPLAPNAPYILHVHGWNMEPWKKDRYAETTFKRLYWQGYQGRFGEFRWPTYAKWPSAFGEGGILNHYDRSEWQAWKSGTGLRYLLTTLNQIYPNQVHLSAHSMGNVVAGEALRNSTNLVAVYVACEAALPAHCYDSTTTPRSLGAFDNFTPNLYAHYWETNSPPYFNGAIGAAKYVNFFNEQDAALNSWLTDQNLKPDETLNYSYNPTNNIFCWGNFCARELTFTNDTHEIFSFCVEPRCFALGAQSNVAGAFTTQDQIDLNAAPYYFGDTIPGHSGQFNFGNSQCWPFWDELLKAFELKRRQ